MQPPVSAYRPEARAINSTAGNPELSLPTAKAAPEDLKKVKAMWKNIIVETSAPFRLALASAEVKYNAQEENDNRLFVVFADFLAERYINNADRKRELESIIADKSRQAGRGAF